MSCITYKCKDIVHKILFIYVNSVSGLYLRLRDTALGINLPCDMYRWLVEGEDIGVVHKVLVRHTGFCNSAPGRIKRPLAFRSTSSSNGYRRSGL